MLRSSARSAEAGAWVKEITRRHGISEQSFYHWQSKYGGMEASDARRLKELEAESAKLKKLLAEAHLDNAALKASRSDGREARSAESGEAAGKRKVVSHLVSAHGLHRVPFPMCYGPEMISKALDEWAYRKGGRLNFIEPGKPVQTAFVESFNGCAAAREAPQRRMSQRALVPAPGRCPQHHRGLADRL